MDINHSNEVCIIPTIIDKIEYSPRFMEYGIISKENFKDIYEIPIKRWDPLSTITRTTDEFGLHKQKERYYGHYAYLSPIRGQRPKGYQTIEKKSSMQKCSNSFWKEYKDVFTATTEGIPLNYDLKKDPGDYYTLIITEDETQKSNPFSVSLTKIEKISEKCKALTLINRYPAMARVIDPEIDAYIKEKLPKHLKLARGINLVTISRNFYPSLCFDLIPYEVLTGIFLSMKEAILYCILEAIERDYFDIPVAPFFNIGSEVGGSQPRIHSQVYIDLNGDGHGSRLEGHLQAFKNMGENCHLCETTHGDTDRIILKTKFWTYYTAGSPIRNYHIRFHPNEHLRRFSQLKINQMEDLAKSMKLVFKALDDIKIDENRNILFNCCPYGYDANFHMFGDIIPHEVIGGAEMVDDMRVALKLPHRAAAEIRKALEEQDQ